MSYTTPPPSGAPAPARPGTVSLATTLLYVLALLSLVSVALGIYSTTFYERDKVIQIYRDAGADQQIAETTATATSAGAFLGAGLALLIGVVYLILAIFVGKGKQWARITSWVWAGLFGVCCGLTTIAGQAAGSALSGMGGNAGGFDQAKANEAVLALQPSWLGTVSIVLGIFTVLAAIGVIILLALPPSSPFFRKAEPQWTPPTYPAP